MNKLCKKGHFKKTKGELTGGEILGLFVFSDFLYAFQYFSSFLYQIQFS